MRKTTKNLIILLLLTIVFVVIANFLLISRPGKPRIREANDSQRWSEINSLVTAITYYKIENQGVLPKCTGNPNYEIPEIATCLGTNNECCNLNNSLVTERYLSSIPKDPVSGNEANTGYLIWQEKETKIICIIAPLVEDDQEIKVCR